MQNMFNGDCNKILSLLQEIKVAYNDKKQVTLQKFFLLKGRVSVGSVCIPELYFDMSWTKTNEVTFDPIKYKITKSTTNAMVGSGATFWAIKYDDILEIKILETENDAEKKIKDLEKWLFGEKQEEKTGESEIYLNIKWYGQFNKSLFEHPCGCWPTAPDSCLINGKWKVITGTSTPKGSYQNQWHSINRNN